MFTKLVQDGSFTEKERQSNYDLVNPDLFPHFYSDKEIPKGLLLEERAALINTEFIIGHNSGQAAINSVWEGDGNPKENLIHNSIENEGYQFKYPAPALLRLSGGQFDKINGRTRSKKVVGDYNYGNIIADIYKPDPLFSLGQVLNAAQEFAESANSKGYHPHGKSSVNDIFHATIRAIETGFSTIELSSSGCPIDDTAIEARIDRVYGVGYLQKKPKETVVRRIMAHFAEKSGNKDSTRFWNTDANVIDYIKRTYKFVDVTGTNKKRGIIYHVIETSSYRKALMEVTQVAIDNPNCEIRVVIYPKYLTGRNLDDNFWNRINTFVNYWNNSFTKLSLVFWNSVGPFMDRVSIYAAVPSLPFSDKITISTLDKPLYLVKGKWKQK
jgi:hypothetical protein